MKRFSFIYIIFFLTFSHAQDTISYCIKEVMEIEETVFNEDIGKTSKTAFIHYKVLSESNTNQITKSEVKMYRNNQYMNFFSDQADIYTDKNESFMILKPQLMIIASSTPQNVMNSGYSADFLKFKKEFMQTCVVESCIVKDSINGLKELKLTIGKDSQKKMFIRTIIYNYDTKNKKILSTDVYYSKDSKVKRMLINYIALETDYNYDFVHGKRKFLTSKGKLLDKYKGYEFIDDRTKK